MKYSGIFFTMLSFFAFSVGAQTVPVGCNESELKKEPNGEARLTAASSIHGTGKVAPQIHPKPDEHGISQSDLNKEIVYYDPIKESCRFSKVGDTPFGVWIKGELAWRKLQKLSPPDVSYHPVEIDTTYTASYWRTLPLTAQANLFDRRATNGMRGLVDGANRCYENSLLSKESSAQLMTDYAEKFSKFYKSQLFIYLNNYKPVSDE